MKSKPTFTLSFLMRLTVIKLVLDPHRGFKPVQSPSQTPMLEAPVVVWEQHELQTTFTVVLPERP